MSLTKQPTSWTVQRCNFFCFCVRCFGWGTKNKAALPQLLFQIFSMQGNKTKKPNNVFSNLWILVKYMPNIPISQQQWDCATARVCRSATLSHERHAIYINQSSFIAAAVTVFLCVCLISLCKHTRLVQNQQLWKILSQTQTLASEEQISLNCSPLKHPSLHYFSCLALWCEQISIRGWHTEPRQVKSGTENFYSS